VTTTHPGEIQVPASEWLDEVQRAVQPHIDAIARHPVFHRLTSITDLRLFMEHHVYAVWDFMSLLKALQRAVTCTEIPWVPRGDPAARRFINEIVLDEESDQVSLDGDPPAAMSHFELYLRAMERVGAQTAGIHEFLMRLRGGERIGVALTEAPVPDAARQFVLNTMEVVNTTRVARDRGGLHIRSRTGDPRDVSAHRRGARRRGRSHGDPDYLPEATH
jgi:hypothetical protein